MTEREDASSRSTTTGPPPPGLLFYRLLWLGSVIGFGVFAAVGLTDLLYIPLIPLGIATAWLVVRDAVHSALVQWDRERGDLA